MKKTILALAGIVTMAAAAAQTGPRGQVTEIFDNSLSRVVCYEYRDRGWDKYRKGDYDNLRVNGVLISGSDRYIVSRYYRKMAREMEIATPVVPIYSFHYHNYYDGCVLGGDQLLALMNIAPGQMLRIESVRLLYDYEAHEYEDFRSELLAARELPEQEFFLLVHRTKRRKKEVVRITDRDDPAAFKTAFWEIPYEDFLSLFDGTAPGETFTVAP